MENVKGYKQKILQKIHFQFCVGNRVKRMQVGIRKRMKFFRTVFKEDDDMNRPDIFVIKVLGITVFDALVLAKQKVCGLYSGLKTSLKKLSKRILTPRCPVQMSRNASFCSSFQLMKRSFNFQLLWISAKTSSRLR